jgi:membrane protease YdiL (CAAX protease family)
VTPETLDAARKALPLWFLIAAASGAGFYLCCHRGLVPALRFAPAAGPREPPLWRGSDVALALAAWFLTAILMSLALAPLAPPGNPTAVQILAGTLLPDLAALGFLALVLRKRLGQPWSTVGFAPAPARNVVPVLAAYLFFLGPLLFVVSLWYLFLAGFRYQPGPQDIVGYYQEALRADDALRIAVLWFTAVAIAPFCEEVIYRGFLFGLLRERAGPGLAAVLSSSIFGAVHTSLSAMVPLVCVGCALCYIYHRTRSLYPAMLFHALFNGVSLLGASGFGS